VHTDLAVADIMTTDSQAFLDADQQQKELHAFEQKMAICTRLLANKDWAAALVLVNEVMDALNPDSPNRQADAIRAAVHEAESIQMHSMEERRDWWNSPYVKAIRRAHAEISAR